MIKSAKSFGSLVILGSMVLAFIATSAYALSQDEPIFRIPETWPFHDMLGNILVPPPDNGGQIQINPINHGRFDFDNNYGPQWARDVLELICIKGPEEKLDIVNRLWLRDHPEAKLVPYSPVYFMPETATLVRTNSLEVTPSSIYVVPEPATILLLGLGGLMFRKRV